MEANYAGKKVTRLLGFAPDYWALHPTTGLCTRPLGFHPTTGLCTRLLGFAPDYWALHPTTWLLPEYLGLHPTTGLCTQPLFVSLNYWALNPNTGLPPEYWAFACILRFYPNTGLSPNSPNLIFRFHYAGPPSQIGRGHKLTGLAHEPTLVGQHK